MKNIFKSKTFWLNALALALPLVSPHVQGFVVGHPAVAVGIQSGLNIFNRIVGTTGPVSVFPEAPHL